MDGELPRQRVGEWVRVRMWVWVRLRTDDSHEVVSCELTKTELRLQPALQHVRAQADATGSVHLLDAKHAGCPL